MGAREPSWWYAPKSGWQAALLAPASVLYGSIASRRMRRRQDYRSRLPVLCVGNFTAGGTGKTPLAIALSEIVAGRGLEAWFLSRGYGGSLRGPTLVDAAWHGAAEVGDEPLLLASHRPTVIARDRRAGAEAIEKMAPDNAVIIMDDGLQNPTLAKNLSIALVDGRRGLGNGWVMPSGPLRAPLAVQLPCVDAIIAMGGLEASGALGAALRSSRAPLLKARTVAKGSPDFGGARVLAYAGIANPDRFFSMLATFGAHVVHRRTFADHHVFDEADAKTLLAEATTLGATLVTTEKDLVRLARVGHQGALRDASSVLSIKTVFDPEDLVKMKRLVAGAIARQPA